MNETDNIIQPLLILGRSKNQCMQFVRSNHLKNDEYKYVYNLEQVRGLPSFLRYIVLDGFYETHEKDADDIINYLQERQCIRMAE